MQELIDQKKLFRVSGAPEFSHSIYAVYPPRTADETLGRVRAGLRASLPGRTS